MSAVLQKAKIVSTCYPSDCFKVGKVIPVQRMEGFKDLWFTPPRWGSEAFVDGICFRDEELLFLNKQLLFAFME